MGGWRCSYLNCTIRADGKTHMFHYPVFDKVRCHQWLVNTGRLDFLNLKVSQLKNRVICQHHFTKDQFMNFKHDKLIFDAVPSLDGPFCDVKESQNKSIEETTNTMPIIFEDIENDEYMTLNDRRAIYSVKYADFLTSNELADIDISSCVPQQNVFNKPKNCELEFLLVHKNNDTKSFYTPKTCESKDDKSTCSVFVHKKSNPSSDTTINSEAPTSEVSKKYQKQPIQVVPPYKTKLNQSQNQIEENFLEIQLPPGFINNNALLTDGNNSYQVSGSSGREAESFTPKVLNNKNINTKVKILSEERISEPLTLTGHLEPVSPSSVLPILQKKPTSTVQKNSHEVRHLEAATPSLLPTLHRKPAGISQKVSNEVILNNQELLFGNELPEPVQTIAANKSVKNKVVEECKVNQDKSPRASLLKNKITPERVAAIKEKRKFNMKLRDIIESFLDKLDEPDKEIKDSECNVSNQQSIHKETYLTHQSNAEKTIANLEARIKKMEDALLSKIDQNSQRIVELKNTIVNQKEVKKKCCATQTSLESQCQKKRLYQEISQYLSPDANSLIYEELFINKLVKNIPKASPAKRKRRR